MKSNPLCRKLQAFARENLATIRKSCYTRHMERIEQIKEAIWGMTPEIRRAPNEQKLALVKEIVIEFLKIWHEVEPEAKLRYDLMRIINREKSS